MTRWEREGRGFDHIVSRPLVCARSIAERIAAARSAPLDLDLLCLEMDNGPLVGLPTEAVARYS